MEFKCKRDNNVSILELVSMVSTVPSVLEERAVAWNMLTASLRVLEVDVLMY
jgi:hypothetical protein